VLGSRRPRILVVALASRTARRAGFLLASLFSKLGIDLDADRPTAALVLDPQGLVMGPTGIAALLRLHLPLGG